jgi:hypothetical protein
MEVTTKTATRMVCSISFSVVVFHIVSIMYDSHTRIEWPRDQRSQWTVDDDEDLLISFELPSDKKRGSEEKSWCCVRLSGTETYQLRRYQQLWI